VFKYVVTKKTRLYCLGITDKSLFIGMLQFAFNHTDCQPEDCPPWTFIMGRKSDQKYFIFRQSDGLLKDGSNNASSKPATE